MKKFVQLILLCLVIVAVPLYMLQFYIDHLGRASDGTNEYTNITFALAYKENRNADIVIMGASRAQCHYDGKRMSKILGKDCLNLGLNGRPFDYEYELVWKPYIKRNTYPKCIIQEISTDAFLYHLQPKYDARYLPYLNEQEFGYYIRSCDELSVADLYFPIKYRGVDISKLYLKCKTLYKDTCHNTDGFTPLPSMKYRINTPQEPVALLMDSNIVKIFNSFIDECLIHNVTIFLVNSPMHLNNYACWADLAALRNFASHYVDNEHIYFLDYFDRFGSDSTLFAESTHLSLLGAEIFSEMVAHDVDSILNENSFIP